jgi:hypothetical protein
MIKLCANGLRGYRVKDDELAEYMPNHPCNKPADVGHIHCDACRIAAGGLPSRHQPATLATPAE